MTNSKEESQHSNDYWFIQYHTLLAQVRGGLTKVAEEMNQHFDDASNCDPFAQESISLLEEEAVQIVEVPTSPEEDDPGYDRGCW